MYIDVIFLLFVIFVRFMVLRDDFGDLIMLLIGYEMVWNDKKLGGV